MSKRKNIKVGNILLEGRLAGPQIRIIAVSERLRKDGIETIVIFPRVDSNPFYSKLTERNIKTKRLRLHHLTRKKTHLFSYFLFFIPELFSLYRLIRKENIDIVHCNSSWQLKGVIAAKLARAKVLWHLNDTQAPFLINIIFRVLSLYLCDAFIISGERVRAYYIGDQRFSNKPSMEMQAPVDTCLFDPQKIKPDHEISKYAGVKIITVGNVNPLKGLEYFIEMAHKLNKQHANLNFFVIGPHFNSQKKYSEKLFTLAEKLKVKNLIFYGSANDIPSILKAADIYVCSSVAEASPISVWEAMSMSKPIVSTDVGDVARFIKDGKNGFMVPIKNSAALAEKVGLLIEDKELRESFSKQVRKIAVKRLDIEICANRHLQFYREILYL